MCYETTPKNPILFDNPEPLKSDIRFTIGEETKEKVETKEKCGTVILQHEWTGSTRIIPRVHRKPT